MTASKNQNKLSVVSLLINTWKIYTKHFSLILGYSSWLLVPFVLYLLISITFTKNIVDVSYIVMQGLELGLELWISVLIIKLTPQLKINKINNTKKISGQSWQLAIPYLLSNITFILIFLTGALFFIIPGIIFFIWFLFTSKIVVLENSTIFSALKKSKELTKDKTMSIFAAYINGHLVAALSVVFLILIGNLLISPTQILNIETLFLSPPTIASQTIEYLIKISYLPFILIFETLLYLEVKKLNH